jgi:hypothetical protein
MPAIVASWKRNGLCAPAGAAERLVIAIATNIATGFRTAILLV